jgi:hypothetical protein
MTTNENIAKAIQMVKDFDFEWRFDDYAYSKGLDEWAKNYMRRFVKFVHTECQECEEQLRNLWIARKERNFEKVESIQEQLMAIA